MILIPKKISARFYNVSLLIIFILFTIPESINSDSPPSWSEFQVHSANKQFVAKVSPIQDSSKEKKNWKLTVLKKGKLIWSCPFEYRFGYPGGILTDDGKIFIMIEVWFHKNKSLVDIYKEGNKIPTEQLTGDSFSISQSDLQSTSSHFLWFDQSNYYKIDLRLNQLILTTIDKREHVIDLNTGLKIE